MSAAVQRPVPVYVPRLRTLAVIFIVDLLLLPMFHPGGMPFKLSFAVLVLWAFAAFSSVLASGAFNAARAGRFATVAFPVLALAAFGLLGQLYLSMHGDVADPEEVVRSAAIYVLMALAFGFGQSVPGFNLRSLILTLYGSLIANFLFILAGSQLLWLAYFYYDASEAQEVLSLARPRGLFGNPNASMLLVNIQLLFIVFAARLGYFARLPKWHYLVFILSALSLAFFLGSRAELVSTVVLAGALLLSPLFKLRTKISGMLFVVGGSILIFVVLFQLRDSSYAFIDDAISRFRSTSLFDLETEADRTILRPFIAWEMFVDRFTFSPIVGAGFSTLDKPPFDASPLYFHNDWFRVLATSGLAGGVLLIILLRRIVRFAHWILLLPFFIPGLTNTFLLNIPAVMFYFFMLGVFIERRAQASALATAYQDRLVPDIRALP